MDGEELEKQLDARFFDEVFEGFQVELRQLPTGPPKEGSWPSPYSDGMKALQKRMDELKVVHKRIKDRFENRIRSNWEEFVKGMMHIQLVKNDMNAITSGCAEARRHLKNTDRALVLANLEVLAHCERKNAYVEVYKLGRMVQRILQDERKLHEALDAGRFSDALRLYYSINGALESERTQRLECLRPLRNRFKDGARVILENLQRVLKNVVRKKEFNSTEMRDICTTFKEIGEVARLSESIRVAFSEVLLATCKERLTEQVLTNGEKADGISKMKFAQICGEIKVEHFMTTFLTVSSHVSDLLYRFYQVEQQVIHFASGEVKSSADGDDKQQGEFQLIRDEMSVSRQYLWDLIQAKLGDLLQASAIQKSKKMKMEQLLVVLHGAQLFTGIGKTFSRSDSKKLEASIKQKCIQYLENFQRTSFEAVKMALEAEMWRSLPVDRDFGVEQIVELNDSIESIKQLHRDATSPPVKDGEDEKQSEEVKGTQSKAATYQRFLLGENVFRSVLDNVTKKAAKRDEKQASLSLPGLLFTAPRRSRNQKKKPIVLTSASFKLVKYIGQLVQMIECLEPVADEAFNTLMDIFDFYLYTVFVLFGPEMKRFFVDERMSNLFTGMTEKPRGKGNQSRKLAPPPKPKGVTDTRYVLLKQTVNSINTRLRMNAFAAGVFSREIQRTKPGEPICPVHLNPGINLKEESSLFGVLERAVASETLIFMIRVFEHIKGRITKHLPKRQRYKVPKFGKHVQEVSEQFTTYMYRNVTILLMDMGAVHEQVQRAKWNQKKLSTEANGYVRYIVERFKAISDTIERLGGLPPHVEHRLLEETLVYVLEGLVMSWASVSRGKAPCSIEGRAQMSLDRSVLGKGIQKLRNFDPLPSFEYVDQFVNAFYLPHKDLMTWVTTHAKTYPLSVHQSFAYAGRAAQDISKKKVRAKLVDDIAEAAKR